MFTFTKDHLQKLSKSDLIEVILSAQNVEAPAPLVETKETEVIQAFQFNHNKGDKILKIDGKKFKIYFESSNGSPLGFNYNRSASVMNESGSWDYVAEGKDINFDMQDCSYVSDTATKMKTAKRFMDEMTKYLEKVYS